MKTILILSLIFFITKPVYITITNHQVDCPETNHKKWLYFIELINYKNKKEPKRRIDFENIDLQPFNELRLSILNLKDNQSCIQDIKFLHEFKKDNIYNNNHCFVKLEALINCYEKNKTITLGDKNCLTPLL